MTKLFMTSVADAYLYAADDSLIGTSRTLNDTGVNVELSSTDIRGGKGNALQYVLYTGAELSVNLMETQFSIAFLAQTLGATLGTGANVFTEEDVTLGVGLAGTLVGTAIAYQGTTVNVWLTHSDGYEEKAVVTGNNFTATYGTSGDVVCARYYNTNAAAKQIEIAANIVPSIVRLELESQLATSDTGSNVIGKVVFTVPQLALSGNFAMTMTADGVSNTPLTGRALSWKPTSGTCAGKEVLGYITQVIDSANYYDDLEALAVLGGDFTLASTTGTKQMAVRGLHADKSISTPPDSEVTYSSSAVGVATVSSSGLVTGVSAGTATITLLATNKTSIELDIEVTVPS